jgi:hypothetical protein
MLGIKNLIKRLEARLIISFRNLTAVMNSHRETRT